MAVIKLLMTNKFIMKGTMQMKMEMRIFTLSLILCSLFTTIGYIPAKAAVLPKLQIVTQPKESYTKGEEISFSVTNTNYIYNVEYRVILYNGTTKKTINLWNTPKTGYYYRGWQPTGNSVFKIRWSASQLEPGAYSMTVLVRRANSSGQYDSHVDTKSFWILDNATDSGLTIVTNAEYDDRINFSEGLAVVHNDNGYSYIDTNGKVKIGPIMDKVFKESDGYGGVISNKYGVVYAGDFHEGLAMLDDDTPGSQIVIDMNGKEIFQSYDVVGDAVMLNYMNGSSVAFIEGLSGGNVLLVDKSGNKTELDMNKITGNDFDRIIAYASDGLLPYLTENEGKVGYVDIKTKKVAIEPRFEDARQFYNGVAPVELDGMWGFINTKGEFVIEPQYEDFIVGDGYYSYQIFYNDIACVEKNGKWGAIDKNGNVVVDFKYDNGFLFYNGMATIQVDDKYGYIDAKGNEVIAPQYDDANYFNNDIALVGKDGTYYLINKKGEKVSSKTWEFEGTYVSNMTPDIVSYELNGRWGIAKITYKTK